jgi:putative membrane protein
MEDPNSLNHSIDDAKKHYRSMFTLPSLKLALAAVAVVCFVIGLLTYAVPSHGLISALLLALSLFALTVVADLAVSKLVLRKDPIFTLRRTNVVSLVGMVFWLIFVLIGVVLELPFGWQIWESLTLIGFAAVVTLRIIVFMATSDAPAWRRGLSVLLQPTLCLVPFVLLWAGISSSDILRVLPFIVLSPIVAFLTALLFFYPIKRLGATYSISSLPLFKAFMANWVTGANAPLEKFFEEMGEDTDVEVKILKFESSKPKAAIIVASVHPGPFKNIGSSLLPSMMKHEFQKEYNCEACTPLGILGHERDLASQMQNQKIVSKTLASAKFAVSADSASPSVRISEGVASTSCQIFGDTVFLSFTLAPETTEDLPEELGRMVSEEVAKYGLKHALVVNSHNSLTDKVAVEEHLDTLRSAASECIRKAVTQPTSQFRVGAASVYPPDFSLKSGMGTGGITAIVVEVQKQKTAYIVIDGNNMVSGLREKLLAALGSAGFSESEVFTTDTHAVSAIVTSRQAHHGYHPIGEAMDQELLTRIILDVAKKAEGNLEASKVGCLQLVVPQVRAIGEARLKSMTTLVHRAIQKIKQTAIPVFALEGLILILILTFL